MSEKTEETTLPIEIFFEERIGTNGIHCLDYKNESDVKYIREDHIPSIIKQVVREAVDAELDLLKYYPNTLEEEAVCSRILNRIEFKLKEE